MAVTDRRYKAAWNNPRGFFFREIIAHFS